jgi:hypothetical protein
MSPEKNRFDNIWEVLLSRDPVKIMTGYDGLPPDQKRAVLEHLEKMAGEPGWQPEQRLSAQAALDAISKDS